MQRSAQERSWQRTCTPRKLNMSLSWPSLPFDAWSPTKETLHRYTQIIGKIQLELTPRVSHFWNVTFHLTAHGLATSALHVGDQTFDIELDLIEHLVVVRTSTGAHGTLRLRPLAVADFQRDLFALLASLGLHVSIWDHPVELKTEPIPFSGDYRHAAYDRDHVERFFHILSASAGLLEEFRARFIGKSSGVGFYWGTFDLCVARYCGRAVPSAPAGSIIEREGYSHEVSEIGFWPGDAVYPAPAFYAMHYPAPDGYATASILPELARWEPSINCFVLPYEDARKHYLPALALEFFQSTYEAGANLAHWDRPALERADDERGQHAA
jgi:hypothetical protein